MKIVIFGATGGIGKHALTHCLDAGYDVVAYVRDAKKIDVVSDKLEVVSGQLFDYEKIKSTIIGADAVISTIGIPMKFKYQEMSSAVGHQNIVRAMEEVNVKRLITWSTPSIRSKEDANSFITVVPGIMASIALAQAKKELTIVSDLITQSNLDWTIVRFMAPKNTPFTGNVKVGFGKEKMKFSISRSDIAYFMVQQIKDKTYIKRMPIIGS